LPERAGPDEELDELALATACLMRARIHRRRNLRAELCGFERMGSCSNRQFRGLDMRLRVSGAPRYYAGCAGRESPSRRS
jgi:hypothetical protein